MKPPLVVGNWKMHGTEREAAMLARQIRKGLKQIEGVEIVLAPPFTALSAVHKAIRGSSLRLGAQDVHWETEGAFTGEISPKMLRESGCRFVIIGHSERRRLFNESDVTVARKVFSALHACLTPILCVGETWQERKRGMTARVIRRQLRAALKGLGKSAIEKLDIAYEPVWAIGTGRNATPSQANEVHRWIREFLRNLAGNQAAMRCRILYGGSVRPDNAGELASAPEINGLLVGGASLKAKDFLSIIVCFVPESR
ncbi:triose-phosphate isomerase [bacterium]|nr:MAG: triose-phosphate isomerase [bacterium]